MTLFDPDKLLRPVDDHSPTGDNLEYDPEFIALEQIATPISERAMGDSLKAAVEPDWDRVASAAEALFSHTKDLRVAIHLTAAAARIHGVAGWSAGLGLVRGLLERYWNEVHPQLDADDDNDVTARSNAIRPLGDPRSVLAYFRKAPFVTSPRLGRFSLRDLRIATGAIDPTPSAEGAPPTLPELEACCMDCPVDQLPAASAALACALDHARAIAAIASEKLGAAGPDLNQLCWRYRRTEEVRRYAIVEALSRTRRSTHLRIGVGRRGRARRASTRQTGPPAR